MVRWWRTFDFSLLFKFFFPCFAFPSRWWINLKRKKKACLLFLLLLVFLLCCYCWWICWTSNRNEQVFYLPPCVFRRSSGAFHCEKKLRTLLPLALFLSFTLLFFWCFDSFISFSFFFTIMFVFRLCNQSFVQRSHYSFLSCVSRVKLNTEAHIRRNFTHKGRSTLNGSPLTTCNQLWSGYSNVGLLVSECPLMGNTAQAKKKRKYFLCAMCTTVKIVSGESIVLFLWSLFFHFFLFLRTWKRK